MSVPSLGCSVGTGIDQIIGPVRHIAGFGQAIAVCSSTSATQSTNLCSQATRLLGVVCGGVGIALPRGACWKEKATIFLTRSVGTDVESRGKHSLMRILIRPSVSEGSQWLCCRTSLRKGGK